jgi:hypothetical protein
MSADLLDTFRTAVGLFNSRHWTDLAPLLDQNVTMKRIDDPVLYHEGKTDVMNYFTTTGNSDEAVFVPVQTNSEIVGKLGLVWGAADWKSTPTSPTQKIAYMFAFRNENGFWLAVNLWGAYA